MTPQTTKGQYTYHRDRDGSGDTFDIIHPSGEHLTSIHFWDEPDSVEAEHAEADAKLIVHRLNCHDRLVEALDYLLEQTVDQDLKYGIGLSEGEEDARAKALAIIAEARGEKLAD
jgi:hypothetical protein